MSAWGHEARRTLIAPSHPALSIANQARLLGISRGSIYYEPRIDPDDLAIMAAIDKIFTDHPFYGSRRIRETLMREEYGICACRDHVRRLMREMGLEAIYPRTSTSIPHPGHAIYPYLLRGVTAIRPNHIWGTDLTYIRLNEGFCYLIAMLDWYSRYVVSWVVAPTMELAWCAEMLAAALKVGTPEIHNSDQGSQYTSESYLAPLKEREILISMDGRGRCMDNIFTERLWRTVKYEEVYLKSYASIEEARESLGTYFRFYNEKRPHQSLGYRTPSEMYGA